MLNNVLYFMSFAPFTLLSLAIISALFHKDSNEIIRFGLFAALSVIFLFILQSKLAIFAQCTPYDGGVKGCVLFGSDISKGINAILGSLIFNVPIFIIGTGIAVAEKISSLIGRKNNVSKN